MILCGVNKMLDKLLLIIGTFDLFKFLIMILHRCNQILHCLTIKKNSVLNCSEIVLEFYGITGCEIHRITPEYIILHLVVKWVKGI
jgi:hypothetical protein